MAVSGVIEYGDQQVIINVMIRSHVESGSSHVSDVYRLFVSGSVVCFYEAVFLFPFMSILRSGSLTFF